MYLALRWASCIRIIFVRRRMEVITIAISFRQRLFSFSASEYTIREITEKRHNYELEKVRQVVVCTDYKMSSVGSNFCDPEFLPQYRFAEEEFKWEMLYSFFDRD